MALNKVSITDAKLCKCALKVQPKGRGAAAGLMMGDLIVAISGLPTQNMTHTDVKNEMLRAGNDLSLTIQR